jgi:hypothetical protein
VTLYVATIYLTAPIATLRWLALSAATGIPQPVLALIFVSVAAFCVLALVLFQSKLDVTSGVTLALAGTVYYYLYTHAFQQPAETIHLIEYGVLPWLLWWAMDWSLTVQTIAMVWVLSADAGVFDELIQHFTPGRFGELHDVVMNWASSTLGMVLMGIVVRKNLKLAARTSSTPSNGPPAK